MDTDWVSKSTNWKGYLKMIHFSFLLLSASVYRGLKNALVILTDILFFTGEGVLFLNRLNLV